MKSRYILSISIFIFLLLVLIYKRYRCIRCNNNVIIYILCANKSRYEEAISRFSKYWWAKPILMKYQDSTFENAFWRQLSEIEYEWRDVDMVGTMSSACYKKINLDSVHRIICSVSYKKPYHHFLDTKDKVRNGFGRYHGEKFLKLWDDLLVKLRLPEVTESLCNYWMCTPEYMRKFLRWYHTECLPTLIAHPYAMTNSYYGSGNLSPAELIKLVGVGYYPQIPFVLERIHKAYFVREMSSA